MHKQLATGGVMRMFWSGTRSAPGAAMKSPAIEPEVWCDPQTRRAVFDLQSSLDLGSFWKANLDLLQSVLPYHSSSLMLGIVDYRPQKAHHHVRSARSPGYRPANGLTVSSPFLAAHPQIKLYTYAQIVAEDPEAEQRCAVQECGAAEWSELVHLAFWHQNQPEAVLSIRRSPEHATFTPEELRFLRQIYPMIEAGLHRLRQLETERFRSAGFEQFLSALPVPVLFLDGDGRKVFATPEAYEMCALWNFGPRQARSLNPQRSFQVPHEIAAALAPVAEARDRVAGQGSVAGVAGRRVVHPQIPSLVARVEVTQPLQGVWARPGFIVTFASEKNLDGANIEHSPQALAVLQVLTPSERRVALLVAEGLRNEDIAARLSKSRRTVEFQLDSIYRKLAIRGRIELARLLA